MSNPADKTRFWLTVLLCIVLISLETLFFTLIAHEYSLALFFGMPFSVSIIAPVFLGWKQYHRQRDCFLVSFTGCVASGVVLPILGIEGAICLLMAAPLLLPIILIGSIIGFHLQKQRHKRRGTLYTWLIVLFPFLLSQFEGKDRIPPLVTVTTQVEIDASRQEVWDELVGFSKIDPPTQALFKSGIAYPIQAKLVMSDTDTVRHCIFNTGAFVEPITTWDAPNHLAFDVVKNPPTIKEVMLFNHNGPPHLEGYFQSQKGEFRLYKKEEGMVLEGTTWYTNDMYPQWYWKLWSQYILHQIHLRVMEHIKVQAEGN